MMLLLRSRGGRDKSRRILLCFSDIVLVTAGITLIFWTLSSVLHILPCTGYIWTDWTKTGGYDRIPTFLGIYYETQGTGWSLITARNTGIFTEAPMSGFCYSLALIIDLYLRPEIDESRQAEAGASSGNRHRLLRMCILTISILSTFSLVSYIMLLLILALKLAEGSKTGAAYGTGKAAELRRAGAANANGAVTGNRRAPAPDDTGTVNLPGRDRAARLAGTVLTSAFAVFIIYFAYVKLTYGSGSIRLNDFAVGFRAWLAHPLMGGGFENLDYLRQFMPEWRMELDTGFSNSPMEILAQGGLYLALPYAYSLAAGLIRSIRMRDMRMLSFIILFTYLFTFTVVPYQYITFAALIYIASADDAGRPTAC